MNGAANGTLGDPAERERRRALLVLPHAAPLAAYAAGLRRPGVQVPDFDPLDGGTAARVLFVLEKPGPGIHPGGYVSRDNDTPTAAAIRSFVRQAGLPRRETALWNLVPWWNGTTAVTAAERAAGVQALAGLLALLPGLDTAVLVGRRRRSRCWAACACWPARTPARRCGLGSGSGGMRSRRCGGRRGGRKTSRLTYAFSDTAVPWHLNATIDRSSNLLTICYPFTPLQLKAVQIPSKSWATNGSV